MNITQPLSACRYDPLTDGNNGNGEKLLLAAILLRAVRDLFVDPTTSNKGESLIAETARQWIFEEQEDEDHITSFRNICMVLDLDYLLVRRQIQKMRSIETLEECASR